MSHVYEVVGWISASHFKSYANLSETQRVEWKNRGFSTFHALLAAAVSFYLLAFSDLFQAGSLDGLVINRHSTVSDTMLGVTYLDVAGQKNSKLYVYNGVALFLGWLWVGSKLLVADYFGGSSKWLTMCFSMDKVEMGRCRITEICHGRFGHWADVYGVARVLLFVFFFTHMYLHFDQLACGGPAAGFHELVLVLENTERFDKDSF
ncbi:hypothetical protein ACLOJK_031587 [Asimina triloba]